MAEMYAVMKGSDTLSVAVTKADFRSKKGLLDAGPDETLEDAGYKLLDPATGKAMKLDAPDAEPKAAAKK